MLRTGQRSWSGDFFLHDWHSLYHWDTSCVISTESDKRFHDPHFPPIIKMKLLKNVGRIHCTSAGSLRVWGASGDNHHRLFLINGDPLGLISTYLNFSQLFFQSYYKKKNSFDGGSEVMSRVRRGVLSLRVVRQMLSWPHMSFTCGNEKFYSLIWYLPPVMQRHLGSI